MKFELQVALRFLREGRVQTALILAGIGTGVGVIIFLSALITGLQQSIIERTLGTQAHVVLQAPEEEARQQLDREHQAILEHIQRPAQRLRSILGWPQLLAELRRRPDVTAATPTVAGSAFAIRGTANRSVALRGVEPESYSGILDLGSKLTEGNFDVTGTHAVVGVELAKELGLGVGDTLRLVAPGDRSEVFTISGLFDVGNKDLNLRWVFISLRSGQTLMDLAGGVSTVEVKVRDIFSAEQVAKEITASTGLRADSWMTLNSQILVGLRSQDSSSILIQVLVILAVVLGIASVLVVSVIQKGRQIGIMRAFGTRQEQVLRIFLIQGSILGLAGSLGGILLGTFLSIVFQGLATNPDGSPIFPVALTLGLYARSVLVALGTGLVGSWLPARRAAALDPAVAIRYE
jgi:lipoprotein-releasing system permease protein